MEVKAEGSLFTGICLLEVREQMLCQDCCIFLIDQKCAGCPTLNEKEAGELGIFSWVHCCPKLGFESRGRGDGLGRCPAVFRGGPR